MDGPLISIIVPIYNGEKFIDRLLDSLLPQLTERFELILVNDGSKDNSFHICNEYAKKYSRIKVVSKENGGSSSARNAGMKVAKGEYISFIDVDDTVEDTTYSDITDVIIKYSPDLLDFGMSYISRYGERKLIINGVMKRTLLNRQFIEEFILPPLLNLKKDDENFILDYVWNKVFKREIIENNGISFNEKRRTWEDRVFVVQYLKYANNYYSLDKCYYNYMDEPNSLSRRYDLQFFDIILENYKIYYNLFSSKYDFNTEYVNNYWCSAIENMIYRSLKEKKDRNIIEKNMQRVLKESIVVKWYAYKSIINASDRKIIKYIKNGNVCKAIKIYKKENFKKNLKVIIQQIIYIIKKIIKKYYYMLIKEKNI